MPTASRKRSLYTVPVPSTSFLQEAYWDGDSSSIRFTYDAGFPEVLGGDIRRAGIRFVRAMHVTLRAESFCKVEHIEDCYDTLVEVEPSPWLEAERSSISKASMKEAHHFMIYLEGGCFELIAQSWSVEEVLVSQRQPGGAA